MNEQCAVMVQLLRRDIRLMVLSLKKVIIDSSLIVGMLYLMYGKLLPGMGMQKATIVLPTFLGTLIIVMVNIGYDRMMRDVLDVDQTKLFYYQATLPLSSRMLVVKYVVSYVLELLIGSLPVFFIGWLMFGSSIDMSAMNVPLFSLVYVTGAFMLSVFFVCVALTRPLPWFVVYTWPLILLPMTLLGGLYYPWSAVDRVAPWIAKVMLLIPSVYFVEGLRSAATGSAVYMSAIVCIGFMLAFALGALPFHIRVIARRRDVVRS